jgi:hypothetical protein
MGVTAGIFLASILLKEMRYLVYIRYLWSVPKPDFEARCGDVGTSPEIVLNLP